MKISVQVVGLAALFLTLAACGDDPKAKADTSAKPEAKATSSAKPAATAAGTATAAPKDSSGW